LYSWTTIPLNARYAIEHGVARVELTNGDGSARLLKRIHVTPEGNLVADFEWNPAEFSEGSFFSTELSFSQVAPTVSSDAPEETWWYPVETLAKSERGLDRTRQGMTALIRWPVALGRGTVQIR
jgi:hypothetical protein